MLIQTHRLIGKVIYELLEDKLQIKLDKEAFKYGCMKPDITPRLRATPHYKEESFDFVHNMIEEILTKSLKVTNKNEMKQFSIKLGVIVHFIVDYFCYAHNCSRYDNLSMHIIYESRLSRKFSSSNLKSICRDSLNSGRNYFLKNKQEILEYIHKKHMEYINLHHDIIKDIKYCMEVSLMVVFAITVNCIEKNSKEVA